MLTDPERDPVAVGVKVTLMVQLLPAKTGLVQVLVWAKSPVAEILVIVSVALPELVSVTDCTVLVVPTIWELKVRLEDDRVTAGAAPVPVKLMVCGLPDALSTMLTEPVREPVAVGLNVTLMVQLAPARTAPPQVVVCAKSPLAEMLVILSDALPELVSVTDCAALGVPTVWELKVRLEGDKVTAGAGGGVVPPPPPPPPQPASVARVAATATAGQCLFAVQAKRRGALIGPPLW